MCKYEEYKLWVGVQTQAHTLTHTDTHRHTHQYHHSAWFTGLGLGPGPSEKDVKC